MAQNNKNETQKNENEIGALWERTSGGGNTFLSGQITINGEQIEIVAFAVNSDNPKAPAWRLLKSTPREEKGTSAKTTTTKKKSAPLLLRKKTLRFN